MTVALSLEAPNSVIDTGKATDIDPSLAGLASRNRYPDAVVSLRYAGDWGHVRAAAILREVGFHNPSSADGEPSNQKTGYGLNLSGTWKLFGKDQLNWQVVGGQAIASYMNDGGVDLAPNASIQAETVKSLGYLVYYNHAWSDKWTQLDRLQRAQAEQHRWPARHRVPPRQLWLDQCAVHAREERDDGCRVHLGQARKKDGSSATDDRLQWSTRISF